MRITIETTETTMAVDAATQPVPSAAADAVDGGAPAADLLEAPPAGAAGDGGREDAGPPPSWLVAEVTAAFQRDPGRFDAAAPSEGEASDAGGAPA